jgi:flagellar motility protein MotE (MotC chaperone)
MEIVSLPLATVVMQILGLPGLIFLIWYFDHRALTKQRELDKQEHEKEREEYAKERAAHKEATNEILKQYRDDVSDIKQLYKNNVELVHNYERAVERLEKVSSEMLSVISLNTQAQTQLVVAIRDNQFCPAVRKTGARG